MVPSNKIILGIDPALNNCGWSIIEYNSKINQFNYISSGVIKARTSDDIYTKLKTIISTIEGIIIQYQPNVLAIEETFVNNNSNSSLKLGIVRGVIIAIALRSNLKILELSPNTIKKTITGNGKADKDQLMYMLKTLLPKANPKTLDESDAIAIALTGCLYNK